MLCTQQGKKPLCVEGGKIRIYNLEELCYYFYNYTYMITKEFFDENFICFCENEINQPALAQKVKESIAHNDSLKNIIIKVMRSSSYYNSDELKKFENSLEYMESQSVPERMKVRADMMAKAGKIKLALKNYEQLLDYKENIMPLEFYARINSNIGVLYTELFMYDVAAEYFENAYKAESCEEYKDYLLCSIMMSENEDKLNRIAEKLGMEEEILLNYKRAFESAKIAACNDDKYLKFMKQFKYEGKDNLQEHYEKRDTVLDSWKEEYRNGIEC